MNDDTVLMTMRAMAWQRAKAEMRAYLETFWPRYARDGKEIENGFDEAEQRINAFIKEFEDNCR